MPVKIACPKCSKKYTLPDSALGKTVKCKECGTTFRTKKPAAQAGTATQPAASSKPPSPSARPAKPAQAKPVQPASPNLDQFGIDGDFQKQADIFGAPLSAQAGAGLDNFAEEDPGFGAVVEPIVLGPSGSAAPVKENPYQSVMTNSALQSGASGRSAVAKRRKKKANSTIDSESYNIARYGMLTLFGSGAAIFLVGVCIFLTVAFFNAIPAIPQSIQDSETLQSLFGYLIMAGFGLTGLAMVASAVGQIMCIFAPESNERWSSGLAAGLLLLSAVGVVVCSLIFGVALTAQSNPTQGGVVALSLFFLVCMGICGIMFVASFFVFINFYRKVGQNVKSKELVASANFATIGLVVATGLSIVVSIIVGILSSTLGEDSGPTVVLIGSLVSQLISLGTLALILQMILKGFKSVSPAAD